jgi:hypothetical protein
MCCASRSVDNAGLTLLPAIPAGPARDKLVQHAGEAVQLDQVRRSQFGQDTLAPGGEPDPDEPRIARVIDPAYQARDCRAVNELNGAVMAEQQVASQVTDRGRQLAWMSLDRDQELVLHVREPGQLGLVLAPPLEPAQAGAERQQMLEVLTGQPPGAVVCHPLPSPSPAGQQPATAATGDRRGCHASSHDRPAMPR